MYDVTIRRAVTMSYPAPPRSVRVTLHALTHRHYPNDVKYAVTVDHSNGHRVVYDYLTAARAEADMDSLLDTYRRAGWTDRALRHWQREARQQEATP